MNLPLVVLVLSGVGKELCHILLHEMKIQQQQTGN